MLPLPALLNEPLFPCHAPWTRTDRPRVGWEPVRYLTLFLRASWQSLRLCSAWTPVIVLNRHRRRTSAQYQRPRVLARSEPTVSEYPLSSSRTACSMFLSFTIIVNAACSSPGAQPRQSQSHFGERCARSDRLLAVSVSNVY